MLVILLPLIGFIFGSLFGRFFGKGVCITTTLCTFCAFLLSSFFLFKILSSGTVYLYTLERWVYTDTLKIDWGFCFDSLTGTMIVVVTFISSLVHLYSTEYMENDPHLPRFMSYLSLFTFFMLILVTANNFLQMFVGWEGVGVSSYLLINFWFTRIQANKAAIKAMLVNRVGDFAMLLAIFTIFFVFNSLNYDVIFSQAPFAINYKILIGGYHFVVIDVICLLLFIGAMGKSAQLGLHTWLPDAMEGPTPVSALIHAATMVTAGVFLIARCSYLFEFSGFCLTLVALIGSATAFFAATTGLFQNDMKRVIAYSTCSQLGYMVFACGLSSYEVGLFHLSNHAFFKALLFLGAGSVIHALADEQDMRKMGGLKNILPFSYAIMLIGSLALIGFPFLAGFYSKDVILEIAFSKYTVVGHFSYILGGLAAFCTAFYSTRLLYLVFLARVNGHKNIIFNAHEGSWRLTVPLFCLAACSLLIGYLAKDVFIGFGGNFWNTALFVSSSNYTLCDVEFLNINYKVLPLVVTLLGVGTSFFLYAYNIHEYFSLKKKASFKTIYGFFNKKWFFDRLYNDFLSQTLLHASYLFFYKQVDRGVIEKLGPTGITESIYFCMNAVRGWQSGFVLQYLSIFVFSVLLFAFFSCPQVYFIFPFIIFYFMFLYRN